MIVYLWSHSFPCVELCPISKFSGCERASIDEVYLDLTHVAETMLMETSPESMQDFEEEIEVRGLAFSEIALLMLI